MIFFLIQQPENMQKVRQEIKRVVVEPYYKAAEAAAAVMKNPKAKGAGSRDDGDSTGLEKMLDYDNIFELHFYTYCFMESLRFESPVAASSTTILTETTQIGPYTIRAGDSFNINMINIHRNKDEWFAPE